MNTLSLKQHTANDKLFDEFYIMCFTTTVGSKYKTNPQGNCKHLIFILYFSISPKFKRLYTPQTHFFLHDWKTGKLFLNGIY